MDLEAATHCVGPLGRDYLSKLPHHVPPCVNLHRLFPLEQDLDIISRSFLKRHPYKSSVPIPIIPLTSTTNEALNGIDSTTGLIRQKMKWQMRKEKILNAVKKERKTVSNKMLRRAEKAEAGSTTVVPNGVAVLAQHLDNDPDPQFSGVCNWYYTGGTLATLTHNENEYLLHASHSGLSCSRIVEDLKAELSFTHPLERNIPVYQITTSAAGAAVRQKSCVSLFSMTETDDKLCLTNIHSVTDKRNPFLSVALQDKSIRKYCTLSNSGTLKLWDVEQNNKFQMKLKVAPGEGVTVSDSWSSLQFVDKKTLLLADRCCLHLLDTRMDMKEKQLAWCPRKLVEQCEQISYVVRSRAHDQVVYTLTNHQALTLDLRFGFCQRWTHMLAAPPYMGFTHVLDDKQELLCFGGQVMSECMVVLNGWNGEDPQAVYLPRSLPSPAQGLLLARQQGVCLEPTLSQRCSQSMIGLTFLPATGGLHIMRQSATGDVFTQQLCSTYDTETCKQLTEQQLTAYTEWAKPTLTQQRDTTTLTVTDVKDMTPMLKALTDTYPPEDTTKSGVDDCWGGWRLSKQYMEDCVDLLAPKILSVWEIEEEDEWQQQGDEETLVEQDPAEKVHNWLEAGNIAYEQHTVADIITPKPRVTSTPYVVATTRQDIVEFQEEPSPWMIDPGQRVPDTPQHAYQATTPSRPISPPPSLLSSGSDRPVRKRQKLFEDAILATPPKRLTPVVKKPTTATKKKFTAGF